MKSIGDRIKMLRKAANLTQSQLGELIGKSKGNISGYENGTYDPSASTIIELKIPQELNSMLIKKISLTTLIY